MAFIVSDNDMAGRYEQTKLVLATLRHFGYDMRNVHYREMHGEQYAEKEGRNHNLWVENNAETVYKDFEGTVEIEL